MGCCRKSFQNIKKVDMFGMPVRLTYQGEDSFKTYTGGCLTLVFIIFATVFLSFSIQDLLDHQGAKISKQVVPTDVIS